MRLSKILGFTLAALWASGCGVTREGLVIEIGEDKIQQQLNSRFPVTKNYMVVNVAATDPKVQLRAQDERVHIGVNVQVTVPTQPVQKGAATLAGKIHYDPKTGEFYLGDATIESIDVTDVSNPVKDQVKEVLSIVTKEALNRLPIYKLDDNDRAESLARLFLKKIEVGDKKLKITMGLN